MLRPLVVILVVVGHAGAAYPQGTDGASPSRPSARSSAPIDLTGYWVSVVTQDWRQRMVTPPRGDYESVPITPEAKKVGDAWDPARDEADGEQCRSYGAPAIMRVPGRVHISWEDDTTLKVEMDAGEQTRLVHFNASAPRNGRRTWQGFSSGSWEVRPSSGSLKVVTGQLRPGYLRKNGVPYSADAVLTEYWDLFTLPNGEQWITITTTVEDPLYLRMPWLTALHFKKERDGGKWDPSPCSATW